jgi:hypothetical protein
MEDLKLIKKYVENAYNTKIDTRSRKAEIVKYRALYFKLACDTTFHTLRSIGEVVNRDHASVLHSKKHLFDYVMKDPKVHNLYQIYNVDVLGKKVVENYRDIEQYNQLKKKYNELLVYKESLKKALKEKKPYVITEPLTDNELKYRKLSKDEAKFYDVKADLVLKSFKWKRKDEQRKEVYDIIVGEPTVENTRGTLR